MPSSSTVAVQSLTMSIWKSIWASLIICCFLNPVLATISVISELTNETIYIINDQPARFIPDQEAIYDIRGYVIYADPPTACTPVKPPPDLPYPVHWILLARRYDCDFQTKIENAQNASYYAIIVHNVGLNSTAAMGVQDDSKLNIFAVFIGDYDGQILRDDFAWPNRFYIRIQDDFSFNGYILPFAIVVGVCFIIVLLFMVRMLWQQCIRFLRERRRNRKRRLPASALKKLPTQKWTKGDPYETCAICIEDFVLHDKIRVLPCSHGFHADTCIDPWLTKGRRVCPICKRRVVLADERFSDSEDSDDSETAPLLGGASTSSTGPTTQSTFVQQRENPFRRAQRRMRDRHQQQQLQQQQRGTVIQNSDSSSAYDDDGDDDDDDFDSSTDPSQSNASSNNHSHKSVLAEIHSSGNNNASSSSPEPSSSPTLERAVKSSQIDSSSNCPPSSSSTVAVVGKKVKSSKSHQQRKQQQQQQQQPEQNVNREVENILSVNTNENTCENDHVIITSSGSSSNVNNNNNPNSTMQEFSGLQVLVPSESDSALPTSLSSDEVGSSNNLSRIQHSKSNAIV